MTRFDSPTQIVLLFTGAALMSVLLIMLLNAEANSRKIHKDPEIVNGNMFTSLGRGLGKFVYGLVRNNHTKHIELVEVDDNRWVEPRSTEDRHRARRSLQSLDIRGFDSMQHPVRHAKHKAKQQPTTLPTTTTTITETEALPEMTLSATTPPPTTVQAMTVLVTNLTEGAVNGTASKNDTSKIVTKRRLDGHDACYNTQEVLFIITLTCGVNFAFVFFVMICVRACSRNNKVEDSYIPCGTDSPTPPDDGYSNYKSYRSAREYCNSTTDSHSSVQDYIDSLPLTRTESMLSLHSLYTGQVAPRGGSDHRRKSKSSLHTAYSMEELLLM